MNNSIDYGVPFFSFYNPDFFGHDIYIEEFGFGICVPNHKFSETRKNHLLQFVFDGISHVTVGNNDEFSVSKGYAFFLPANIPHSYVSDQNFPTTRAWISWSGEQASTFTEAYNVDSNPYCIKINNLDEIIDAFHILQYSRDRSHLSLANIYYNFWRIISNCLITFIAPCTLQKNRTSLFNDIVHYIDDAIAENLSISLVAKKFGYDTSALYRLFKQHTNLSPKEYIQHRRLAIAKGLINESNTSLDDIARLCGYSDKSALNMLFIREKNMSLSEYVSKHRTKKHNSETDK